MIRLRHALFRVAANDDRWVRFGGSFEIASGIHLARKGIAKLRRRCACLVKFAHQLSEVREIWYIHTAV
jgi:hypothetical protein